MLADRWPKSRQKKPWDGDAGGVHRGTTDRLSDARGQGDGADFAPRHLIAGLSTGEVVDRASRRHPQLSRRARQLPRPKFVRAHTGKGRVRKRRLSLQAGRSAGAGGHPPDGRTRFHRGHR